MAEGFESNH